jgi:acetaldehyde dehydrogenase (acetylating)
MGKIRVGILGSGQIGTDLAVKLTKEPDFELALVAGRRNDSPGIQFLNSRNITTSANGIEGLLELGDIKLVFDCTSARDHKLNWMRFLDAGISAIDLTPAKIGTFFVPNVTEVGEEETPAQTHAPINLNMVTCGGQSASPIAFALAQYREISRIELASNIASKSAGPATRANIDEYIQTTESVLLSVTRAAQAKAILILNPAEPPITMQNTLYVTFKSRDSIDLIEVNKLIKEAVRKVQLYVPGYRQVTRASMVGEELMVSIQVKGNGDYLPAYSGNLDIINSAAIEAAKSLVFSGRLQ